jgi:hypothetical protein
MAAVGVATVAALEVVGSGEDQIRTFIVEVFRTELVAAWLSFLFCRGLFVDFDWLRHGSGFVILRLFPFTPFQLICAADEGTPLPPYLAINPLLVMI